MMTVSSWIEKKTVTIREWEDGLGKLFFIPSFYLVVFISCDGGWKAWEVGLFTVVDASICTRTMGL